MPYAMGLDGHLNSQRFRNSDPPSSDSVFAYFREPPRPSAVRMPSNGSNNALNDARTSLHRRFTTNALATPTGQQRGQAAEQLPPMPDLSFALNQRAPLSEKKKAEYEYLKQKQLQRQSQMDILNSEAKREEMELHRLSSELGMSNGVGHQSEPTTPPEYGDNGFPTALSRPNRFSTSSLISPPGAYQRISRPEALITSPPSERARAYDALTSASPAQSQPRTRNQSDEEGDYDHASFNNHSHRSAASLNRNSMPVTRRDHGAHNSTVETSNGLGSVDTTSFLFRDENNKVNNIINSKDSRNSVSYLQMNETDDQFPVLLRRDRTTSNRYSGSALDLLSNHLQDVKPQSSGWSGPSRASQPGLAMSAKDGNNGDPTSDMFSPPRSSGEATSLTNSLNHRHSLGAYVGQVTDNSGAGPSNPLETPAASTSSTVVPATQSSLSTNETPTTTSTSARSSNRHSREISSGESQKEEPQPSFQSLESAMHSNAASFSANAATSTYGDVAAASGYFVSPTSSPQGRSNSYGLQNSTQSLNGAMTNLGITSPSQWNASTQMYPQALSPYGLNHQYHGHRAGDSQSRVVQQRRTQNGDDSARFANVTLESLNGEIYALCKDQHGCRFLQKKLEDDDAADIELIFKETKDHMFELMTDPFGNYLCQKLLEHTDTDQHTVLIQNAGPHMVRIALNQHGTRALQKMIEYVSNEEQVSTVVVALKDQVVAMIQDLNGNHVIQKCLNRLTAENAQFVFDSVSNNVVAVGTHRHGCCVIQRCIDHATPSQKSQLIDAITRCSFPLVQDPFGNYVLQYIFDQGEDPYSQHLCRTFLGNIAVLSKQKFSSNVIEKCLRIANDDLKHLMIDEMLNSPEFERLADDAFANYVVQTAWDHASAEDEARIAERIRPFLSRMRHKPHGRRFQTRIADRDKRLGLSVSGTVTPTDLSSPGSIGMMSNGYPSFPHQVSTASSNSIRSPSQSSHGGVSLSGFSSPAFQSHSATPAQGYGSPVQRFPNAPTYQSMTGLQGFANMGNGMGYPQMAFGHGFPGVANGQNYLNAGHSQGAHNISNFQGAGPNQQPFGPYGTAQDLTTNGFHGNGFNGFPLHGHPGQSPFQ
ncbi:MAG: hypothetical protein M1828_006641 [Chrysothrix sp. TS-e1954]|nr:MAG: hypothetical protein M1828_006641 [Chrysothrix sp. TS-e1954]